ncbi:hypothetical protein P3T76_002957 [Phytophthora citrophthora]|uniref:FHA domain-containing protein n=1 Tax=Phytophthora citrophthora TaxID=4793 RepID=A0AAD9LTB0_9STRA|nr:hypothetical protein P3T76_002957 [Phytophthora citrophthora]
MEQFTFENRRQEAHGAARGEAAWGRLVLLTKNNKSDVPDHFDLLRSKHRVGRVSTRSDLLITKQFISGLHCSIQLRGKDDRGEPIVEVEDHSLHGTYVNGKKIGLRRSAKATKGDRINFSAPGASGWWDNCSPFESSFSNLSLFLLGVNEIAYKLEILPSGLTKQNEELHARLSADEMSVAGRTRKRIHEELQSTQSPTSVVVSPPRPRPAKKLRVVSLSQQSSQEYASRPASQSGSERSNTPATQQSVQDNKPQTKAPGKSRRRPDDKTLEEIQKENAELRKQNAEFQKKHIEIHQIYTENSIALIKATKQLDPMQKEVEAASKEILALKNAHEEELKKMREQAAADLAKKDEELKKMKDELKAVKETLDLIVADPTKPQEVRSVDELSKAIYDLNRQKDAVAQDVAMQKNLQDRTDVTPPSKRMVAQMEKATQIHQESKHFVEMTDKYFNAMLAIAKKHEVMSRSVANADLSNLSGSSQSQDSIDAGQLRRGRRSSQLSVASNEHSEPSPPDAAPTTDTAEEIKRATSQDFNNYGASSATSNRPDTMSRPPVYRSGEQRAQVPQGTVEDEETKGGDEETKGGDEETEGREADEETKGEDNNEETKGD